MVYLRSGEDHVQLTASFIKRSDMALETWGTRKADSGYRLHPPMSRRHWTVPTQMSDQKILGNRTVFIWEPRVATNIRPHYNLGWWDTLIGRRPRRLLMTGNPKVVLRHGGSRTFAETGLTT
jgi:hypothetical protein